MVSGSTVRAAWEHRGMHYWFWPAAALTVSSLVVGILGVAPLHNRQSVVLHYTPAFGIDRLGPWYAALVPAALALLVLAVNTIAAVRLLHREAPIAYLIGTFTAILEFGFLAASVLVVLLNR